MTSKRKCQGIRNILTNGQFVSDHDSGIQIDWDDEKLRTA